MDKFWTIGLGGLLLTLVSVLWLNWSLRRRVMLLDATDYWRGFRALYAETQWRYNTQWNREHPDGPKYS